MIHLHLKIEFDGLGIEHHVPVQKGRDEIDYYKSQQDLRVVTIVERIKGKVGDYFQKICLRYVLAQLQKLQPYERKVVDVKSSTFLDDDVFSGEEEVFYATVQQHEVYECLG